MKQKYVSATTVFSMALAFALIVAGCEEDPGSTEETNELIGTWVNDFYSPDQFAIFTPTRVYFSYGPASIDRQGKAFNEATNTITMGDNNGTSRSDRDFTLAGNKLTIEKIIDGTSDLVLVRRNGSTATGIEDTWVSEKYSTPDNTCIIVIRDRDKGGDVLYNWGHGTRWINETYKYDDEIHTIVWHHEGTTSTSLISFTEDGKLKIKFPILPNDASVYNGRELTLTKTNWF